jgi:hypothetical protein
MSFKWDMYKGKQILYVDYGGLNTEDMIKLLKESCDELNKSRGGVLLLASFENTTIESKFMNEVNRLGKEIITVKASKTALLGISGVKGVLVQGYTFFTGEKNLKSFSTERDAMEWLIA